MDSKFPFVAAVAAAVILISASLYALPNIVVGLSNLAGIQIAYLKQWQISSGFNSTLAVGSRDTEVLLLQQFLSTADPNVLTEDKITGYFGTWTESAIRSFQNANGVPETGVFDAATRQKVNDLFYRELCPETKAGGPDLGLFPVSRAAGMPLDYIPARLVSMGERVATRGIQCMDAVAAGALERMFADAAAAGAPLTLLSGYRKPEIQEWLLAAWSRIEPETAYREVAAAGHSEHQLGTAADLGAYPLDLDTATKLPFEDTLQNAWLTANAHRYGFVQSYPKGGEPVTGYSFEPWHYRYVGEALASRIHLGGYIPNQFLVRPY